MYVQRVLFLLLFSLTSSALWGADDPLPKYARARLGTTRFRHGIPIRAVAFTPDGRTILSLGTDNDRLRVWNAETGQHLRDLESGQFLSRDGQVVSVIHLDHMNFIDLQTGKQLGTISFKHHDQPSISPDGKLAAQGDLDFNKGIPFVQLWDVPSGKPRGKLTPSEAWREKCGKGDFRHLVFSPNDQYLLASEHGSAPCIWVAATGKEMPILEGFVALRGAPTFSPDGKVLAGPCAEEDPESVHCVRIWDIATGKRLRDLDTGRDGRGRTLLRFSPDGKRLAAWGENIPLHIWDVDTGKALPAPDLNSNDRNAHAAFSPDGKLLAATAGAAPLRLFDVDTGKVIHTLGRDVAFERYDSRYVPDVLQPGRLQVRMAFSPDGKILAAVGDQGVVRRWDVASGKELHSAGGGHEGYVLGLTIAPDGKRAASAGGDNTVRLWNLSTAREERSWAGPLDVIDEFDGINSPAISVAFSLDGKQLATGWGDGRVRKFDSMSGAEVGQFRAHNGNLRKLAFLPDGRLILTGLRDGRVSLWGAEGGKLRDLLPSAAPAVPRGAAVRGMTAVAPSGRLLAVVVDDDRFSSFHLQLWELASGQLRRKVAFPWAPPRKGTTLDDDAFAYRGPASAVCFAPDERTLAWSSDTEVVLVDTARGKELRRFTGQRAPVYDLAFSPDGKLLGAASSDGSIRLWDVATATLRAELTGHRGGVLCLAFTPDSRSLVSGGSDSTLLVWDLPQILADMAAPPKAPDRAEADALWEQLADPDARCAGQALSRLLDIPPQAITLLRDKLQPAAASEGVRARRLLEDLGSDQFDRRKTATDELMKLIDVAEPLLLERLKDKPPLELQRRIEQILQATGGCLLDPQRLRALRAVELLEQIGTAEARQVLDSLARGAPEARLTRNAKAALKRLDAPVRP